MKFTVQTYDKCQQFKHDNIIVIFAHLIVYFANYFKRLNKGHAFTVDHRSKLALLGGQFNESLKQNLTYLVNLNEPHIILKTIQAENYFKWNVLNYDWDSVSSSNPERYLQTRHKIIELVNLENSKTFSTLNSNSKYINDAKWSPFKPNVLASISNDHLLIWNSDVNKPTIRINSIGDLDCLAWSRVKENIIAVSANNDIRIYDIRKTNSALRYITKAHMKKIYSLDWCWTSGEEILISSSRDKNIKLWNFNMLNQNFMDKIIEDFPCWKTKFLPYGLCFVVLPTCQSSNTGQMFHLNEITNKYTQQNLSNSLSNSNSNLENEINSNSTDNVINNKKTSVKLQRNEPTTSLLVCQITAFNEAKINKFLSSNPNDMIMNFDFFINNDKLNIASWSKEQHLSLHSIDLNLKDLDIRLSTSKLKDDEDIISSLATTASATIGINKQLTIQPATTTSSRKSSFSEYGNSTPPTNISSYLSCRTLIQERETSFTDDQTYSTMTDFIMSRNPNSNSFSISNSQNILKSSSTALTAHEFLKRNPKCFGTKFSGLPEQMIIFLNQGDSSSYSKSAHQKETNMTKIHSRRARSSTNKQLSKQSASNRQIANQKRVQAKVLVLDISLILNVKRDLAEKFSITGDTIEKMCENNLEISILSKRFDIAKIWEMIKFVTLNNGKSTGQEYDKNLQLFLKFFDEDRPWPYTTFGRSMVNSLIDNCVLVNDYQTAALIIAILKQYDENNNSNISKIVPKLKENQAYDLMDQFENSSLIDKNLLKKFDIIIKYYCELLHKWGYYTKRVEMLEFLSEKPPDMDEKFEFYKRCFKCSSICEKSKCKKCNSYMMYCSLCELPVNGLCIYCPYCGHGGHYDHLFEWFKYNEDCPSACGCRCCDYL